MKRITVLWLKWKRWDSYGASNIARSKPLQKNRNSFNGSNVGLMRAVADGALNAGGQ
jgi:predicted Rossmann-fold nucleotide-binding protein